MKIRVIRGRELGPVEIDQWRTVQARNPEFESPYFCPEFTQAVAAVRDDVFVAVLEEGGQVRGFFPHHRRRFGLGQPVGGRLCDVHGVVADPDLRWGWPSLLRACRLAHWEYHAALRSQIPASPKGGETRVSHTMDLTGGLDEYVLRLKAAGSGEYQRLIKRRRQFIRDYGGDVEFVEHTQDHALLDTLIEWKSRHYREGGATDNFAVRWTRDLLHRILVTNNEFYSGMLSVLRVGGKPAAIHMGMRSKTVWHWWFPRHDDAFGKYSPGSQVLGFAAERAPGLGLRTIDLGYGDEPYKLRFRTGSYPVVEGRAQVASITGAVVRCREDLEQWLRSSPLFEVARIPGRLWTRWERARRMR